MPVAIYLEHVKFSPDNQLLTVSSKPMRRNLATHYKVRTLPRTLTRTLTLTEL